MSASTDPASASPRGDMKTVAVVGVGHFFSHFYLLVLPPLFPLLKDELGVSYTSLGLLVSAISLSTGIFQIPAGYVVDRYGPVMLLAAGLALEASAFLLMGLSSSYQLLLLLVFVAGIGNSVFHPADYTILSAAVGRERLGRAFSIHTFSGHAGWAVAPLLMAFFAMSIGWRAGLIIVGLAGLAAAALILFTREHLKRSIAPREEAVQTPAGIPGPNGIGLLMSVPVLMCFLFFVLLSMGQGGLHSFLVSALVEDRGVTLSAASFALTAMFAGSSMGVLVGGVIADRTRRHGLVAACGLSGAATMILIVGEAALPMATLTAFIAMAGFSSGLVAPSRDLIVRAATPEGSTGKVFGFVSTGLSVGGVVTPLVYGWVLDAGGGRWMFWMTAAIMMLAIATVITSQRRR
ncbi:MAG: MFS transporter [Proteobacteria bacterium]|nr:MFS transporter [Pseudomonadota bacterium]